MQPSSAASRVNEAVVIRCNTMPSENNTMPSEHEFVLLYNTVHLFYTKSMSYIVGIMQKIWYDRA